MTWGFLICVYGFFIQLMAFAQASGTTRYAAWYDPASPSIACFTLGACVLITNIAKRAGRMFGVWELVFIYFVGSYD